MIIWKSMVGECLQCVKGRNNEVDKNTVAVVRTNSYCKEEWLAMCNKNLPDSVHVSISASLRLGHFCN